MVCGAHVGILHEALRVWYVRIFVPPLAWVLVKIRISLSSSVGTILTYLSCTLFRFCSGAKSEMYFVIVSIHVNIV